MSMIQVIGRLPDACLLVGIKRGAKDIIPKGNTMIYSGDYLNVLVDENKAASTKEELLEMSGTPRL